MVAAVSELDLMKISTYEWHQSHGARFEEFFGWEIPSDYGNFEEEYRAIRNSAGIRDVSFFGKIRMSGKDRQRFLNGMISNEVKSLQPGNGAWALFLDIKGHVQADMKVYAFPDHFLIVTQPYVADRLVKALDRYIISENVQMTDVTEQLAMLQILGPNSEALLRSASLPDKPYSFASATIADRQVQIIRLTVGYALLMNAVDASAVLNELNGPLIGRKAFEIYRVESGMALLDIDVEETNFPQERRWDGALNFQKGCYLGQEVMARIDAQGHVNKFLVGFAGESSMQRGDKIYKDEKEVGKITSAVHSLKLNQPFGMGYVRRELANEGETVTVGENRTTAIVKRLPI